MQNNHNRKTWETIAPKDLLSPAGRKYVVSKEPDVTVPLLISRKARPDAEAGHDH